MANFVTTLLVILLSVSSFTMCNSRSSYFITMYMMNKMNNYTEFLENKNILKFKNINQTNTTTTKFIPFSLETILFMVYN